MPGDKPQAIDAIRVLLNDQARLAEARGEAEGREKMRLELIRILEAMK